MSSDAMTFPDAGAAARPWLEVVHDWVTTVDHKRLGILYISYALIFLVIGGIEAAIIRIQLIRAHNDFVSPQVFNRMFTMHGTTMIFFVAMPVLFGFANYLVPLMIGARDMAFPRLNAFSFWLMAFGGFLLYFSFLGGNGLYGAGNAPDVGWWAYAPLAAKAFSPGHSSDYWTISLLVSGFGSIGTAVNLIATILCMRCPGMTLGRMPLLAWLNLVMSGMVLVTISPLTAAQIMLLVDRYLGGHFFDTQAGGSAAIWMHFFWIFGHPEVYVLIIPCFAFMSTRTTITTMIPVWGDAAVIQVAVIQAVGTQAAVIPVAGTREGAIPGSRKIAPTAKRSSSASPRRRGEGTSKLRRRTRWMTSMPKLPRSCAPNSCWAIPRPKTRQAATTPNI
jgi:cytochrome c oxidase subunit I